jgi:hypothetical protein
MAVMVELLVVTMLIGTTSMKMRSELVDFSLFFSFWCFMPKGDKLEGSILFDAMWYSSWSFMSYSMRVV